MSLVAGLDGQQADVRDVIFKTSADKQYELGQRIIDSQGCVYRYAKNGGTALDNNQLLQSPARIANHYNQTIVTAAAAGTKTFPITPGGTGGAKDLYADGFLQFNDAGAATTQDGYAYRVKSHPAITASTAFNITLYDPLQIALTTAGQWTLLHNPYSGVIVSPTTQTGPIVGISRCVVTASYYCWIQTWGVAAVLINGTPAIGAALTHGASTAGSVDIVATNGQKAQIAMATVLGVSGEYTDAWLMISP